jgi:putative ABC transport system permease protein
LVVKFIRDWHRFVWRKSIFQTMFKNYCSVAWRYILKNKTSSFINIGGLALGMAVAILIGLWIYDELSFNGWHKNYNQIAQVKSNANYNGEVYTIDTHPMPLGTELRNSYGRDFKYVVMSTHELHTISTVDKRFNSSGNFMQPDAPDMLTLKMRSGSRGGLKDLNSILLSESLAKKIFGNEDPLNKVVNIDNKLAVKVSGVYEDLPDNSDFRDLSFIAPFDFYLSSYDWAKKKFNDWSNISVSIYTQLNPGISFAKASADIKNLLMTHSGADFAKRKPELFLQPMSRWHLYSSFENGINTTSDQLRMIWLYGTIGVFVLLLACINFMNLSTARSEKRAREVGIRKAIGSVRFQLIAQFFSESLIVSGLAFMLAIVLVQCSLPWFNDIAGKKINIPWANPIFWLSGGIFSFFTGLIAGSYPALYLSSFSPVKVLKGTFHAGRWEAVPRKALVVMQFTVSIVLMIGTTIVYRQIQFGKNRPVGYNAKSLLQIQINSPEFQNNYNLFSNEVKRTGVVSESAESASPVTSIWSTNRGFSWKGKENTAELEFSTISVSSGYGKTIGWQFLAGRDFSKEMASDSFGFVINETAAKLMGLENPVGETVNWDQIKEKPFRILGVVRDMVMESPYALPSPTLFFIHQRDGANCMFLRLNPHSNSHQALATIEAKFKTINPNTVFEYSFVDDEFNKKFASEERISKLAGIFGSLAIVISCLGLFGLASFMAEQRTKEIGVRKVLGATVFNLWGLMSRDFIMLILISLLIATPAAYLFMHRWLQNYPYRIEISWWIFVAAALATVFITLLTVSFQSIKAALMNPVTSLRSE